MANQNILSEAEWKGAVKRRLGESEFQLLGVQLRPLNSDGAGFLGDHIFADVTIRLNRDPKSSVTIHFFFKTLPQGRVFQRIMCQESGSFQKEVDVLGILFEDMRSVLKDGGKHTKWTCECFLVRPDLILLEDLSVHGFTLVDVKEPLGYQHCAVVIKALANLHATSIIFEEKRRKNLGTEYAEILKESFFRQAPENPSHPGIRWMKSCISGLSAIVNEARGEDYFDLIKKDIEEACNSLFEFEKPSRKYRNVVNQGDMWSNNVLFRMKNGEPVEAMLVDFQLTRYTPPGSEVMCFLHLTTTREFRAQHQSQLLSLYHAHFSQNLKEYGLNANHLLPWGAFKESCDFYKTLGIIKVACYGTVIFNKKESLEAAFATTEYLENFLLGDKRKDVILSTYRNDLKLKGKLDEIMEEFIEECVINKDHLKVIS